MKNDGGTLGELILKINELKVSMNELIKLEVSLDVDLNERLNALEMLNLFRIIQEFVQNTVKYGKASEVWIQFAREVNELKMTLKDDGVGFDPKQEAYLGNGLGNMQKRCEQCQGEFELYSGDNGTQVVCTLNR